MGVETYRVTPSGDFERVNDFDPCEGFKGEAGLSWEQELMASGWSKLSGFGFETEYSLLLEVYEKQSEEDRSKKYFVHVANDPSLCFFLADDFLSVLRCFRFLKESLGWIMDKLQHRELREAILASGVVAGAGEEFLDAQNRLEKLTDSYRGKNPYRLYQSGQEEF